MAVRGVKAAKEAPAKKTSALPVLSERQEKWFASVAASLERDTGKTLEQWVRLAKKCPETAPKKRADWLRDKYGLGVNRAAQILSAAFPEGPRWDEPDALLDELWKEPEGRAIYEAVAKLVRKEFPDAVVGPRKTFVSFSRKIQFAAILPAKGGKAELGLPLPVSESKRLTAMKRRPWAEKHSALLVLSSPKEVDAEVRRLLKLAWVKGAWAAATPSGGGANVAPAWPPDVLGSDHEAPRTIRDDARRKGVRRARRREA